jgi:SAM-dependent methyltransferase
MGTEQEIVATFPILQPVDSDTFLDSLTVEANGIARLVGWSLAEHPSTACAQLHVNGKSIPPLRSFRTYRPDVAAVHVSRDQFLGSVVEYHIPEGRISHIGVFAAPDNRPLMPPLDVDIVVDAPHYAHLLDTDDPKHRQDIYGSGPPVRVVSPEVWAMVSGLGGPVLDFGCGAGTLIKMLRESGVSAFGLELREDRIVGAIWPEIADRITLYDGQFPCPFEDGSFESVVSIEVVEHISDYAGAISEIARLTRRIALVTVPDISAIPLLHRHQVVPWHLLEATHVNFFNQDSLDRILSRHFRKVSFRRIGHSTVNGTDFWVSLAAQCEK